MTKLTELDKKQIWDMAVTLQNINVGSWNDVIGMSAWISRASAIHNNARVLELINIMRYELNLSATYLCLHDKKAGKLVPTGNWF